MKRERELYEIVSVGGHDLLTVLAELSEKVTARLTDGCSWSGEPRVLQAGAKWVAWQVVYAWADDENF